MSSIAPGWYPDPDPSAPAGRQRWYSGEGWTQHVEQPVAVPAAPQDAAPSYAAQQPGMPQQPAAGQVPQSWGPTPQSGGTPGYPAQQGGTPGYPTQQAYGAPGYPTQLAYGAPAAPSYGDPFGQPWSASAQYGGQRVAVGSMSTREFKALPKSVRKATDRLDIDLALGKNRLARDALTLGILSIFFNPLCIVSITGIVRSTRALRRANQFDADGYPPLGRGQALAGRVLSVIATILWPVLVWLTYNPA